MHDLVLVGAGHTHVQVLRSLQERPLAGARVTLAGARVTLVVDDPVAIYSGMVPGFVAGQYRRHELAIDARPLAERAGAAIVIARATGIDAAAQRIAVEGGAPIAYDTASFDIGSLVAGLDVPGAREHALATRPIGRFVGAIDAVLARAVLHAKPRIVVCGGGAGGVELSLALRARLARDGMRGAAILLVDASARVLPGLAGRISQRVARELRTRDIELRTQVRVVAVEERALVLDAGERLPFDVLVWATGAASQSLFRDGGLPVDEHGFVRVRPTLQVEGHDGLFAAGDCARFEPDLPKAGVYAVRQGPPLDYNLRAHVGGTPLRPYQPQRDTLVLLNLGDGSALGTKWGFAIAGRPVFALKDAIDRRFVRRFQVA